jgi:hypothetical protein
MLMPLIKIKILQSKGYLPHLFVYIKIRSFYVFGTKFETISQNIDFEEFKKEDFNAS